MAGHAGDTPKPQGRARYPHRQGLHLNTAPADPGRELSDPSGGRKPGATEIMITTELIPTGERFESLSDSDKIVIARRIQWLLWEDFSRLPGMHAEDISPVVDPANDTLVSRQIDRLTRPVQGTHYAWLHNNDGLSRRERTGVVKIGPHTRGDQKPYGTLQSFAYEFSRRTGIYPEAVGLHGFALESNSRHLATAALRSVYANPELVPETHELRASVDTGDRELHRAFDAFGATRSNRDAPIAIGPHCVRRYVQRTISPKISL